MILFIAIATTLTLLAVAWMIRPLLWPRPLKGISSQRLNASIYREQLTALEREFSQGAMDRAEYEGTRDELQLRLLDDTEPTNSPSLNSPTFWTGRRTAALVSLLVPLSSFGMYWWLGNPAAMNPVGAGAVSNEQIVQMVDSLAERLKANPDNPQGWVMLARSYKVMGRLAEADDAFKKAGTLVASDPDLLLDYADVLAARADYSFEGRPTEMINQALLLNPSHPMGLMMSGMAAFRRADFTGAIAQWEKLQAVLEPGSPDAAQIETALTEARVRAGLAPAVPSASANAASKTTAAPMASVEAVTPEKINQMVERLATRLKSNPDDLNGWARLALAYKVQGRLDEAEVAYDKARPVVEGNADLLTQNADLLATRADGKLNGRPLALVNKALAINPQHPVALMMAGSAAFQRADFTQAIAHWEKTLPLLDPGSREAALVTAELAKARAKLQEFSKPKSSP